MIWLMLVIWGMGWLGSVMLALTVWNEQRGYVARHELTVRANFPEGQWDERYDPAVLRAAARMVIFGWAWPLLVLRTVYRLTGEFVGKLMIDATTSGEKR